MRQEVKKRPPFKVVPTKTDKGGGNKPVRKKRIRKDLKLATSRRTRHLQGPGTEGAGGKNNKRQMMFPTEGSWGKGKKRGQRGGGNEKRKYKGSRRKKAARGQAKSLLAKEQKYRRNEKRKDP